MKSSDTFVSVDLETTGLDPRTHEIIEIGAVKVENGEITGEYSQLVKPVHQIPEFITNLTGIRDSDVEDAPSVDKVIPSFLEFADGYKLMGQNVGFDVSFLRRHGRLQHIGDALDNIELARILLPQLPSYSLDSLIEFFSLVPENRHRALDDARITAVVFLKLLDMLYLIPPDYVSEMYELSQRAGSSLMDVFESHLRERITVARKRKEPLSVVPPPEMPQGNNIFGDFSGDTVEKPPGEEKIDPAQVSSLLSKNGALSKVYESYEERSGQIALAEHIAVSFNDSELLLSEAGTGVGKSLAYLIPALLWTEKTNERVVISTNTKNLQEQLFNRDIPLLKNVLDFPFRAVILKGRGNYLCHSRWNRLNDRYLSKEEKGLLLPVASWLNSTVTGDLSETGFFTGLLRSGLMEKINSDSPFCLGQRCKYRDQCFVNRVRKAALHSHVIIVNHSLVFSDMASDGGVLGQYSRLVFDEAHNIEKVATRFLGVILSYYRVRRILNRLYSNSEGMQGQLAMLDEWIVEKIKGWPEVAPNRTIIESAIEAVKNVRSSTSRLFENLYSAVRMDARDEQESHEGKLRYYSDSPSLFSCREDIGQFNRSLSSLIESLEDVRMFLSGVSSSHLDYKEETILEIEELQIEVRGVLNDTAFLVEASGNNVFWFEYNENGSFYSLKVQSAPLDIGEKLASGLYDHMETVIMTSATLTVAQNFSYIRSRLGLDLDTRDRIVEFIAASPFDYKKQAEVIVPMFLPSPKAGDFIRETNEILSTLAHEVKRGMLVLFTSRNHLQQAYWELKDRFTRNGITLLAQGVDGSRNVILRRFQKEHASILFGTDSFWEGVDVPGNALELVIILRLPFSVPTEPVVQAQMEEVEKKGGNSFMDYSVPEAAIKLRQGAGRLIRHRNDKGAIIIMDNRVRTTRYGHLFRKSLPGTLSEAATSEMLVENVKRWFENKP